MKRLHLLAATFLTSTGVLSPAMAQTAPPDNSPAPAETRPQATANSGDIIVTARRRSESLTSVPVSVTVLSGENLARSGVLRLEDLQRSVPSVRATPSTGRRSVSQYEIRGITTTEPLITQDQAVGVYVNEVYRARTQGVNQGFFDVANVQVLYGPQGTLFGRNSTAGAVLITTNVPTQKFEGEVSAGIGNYDRRELTGMINLPITDTLAVRLAGQRVKRDGYGRNVTNGAELANENTLGGRFSIAWNPSDRFSNTTVFSYFKSNEAGSLNILYGYRPCPAAGVTPRPAGSCNPAFGPGIAAAFQQQKVLGPLRVAHDATLYDFRSGTRTLNPEEFERARNFSASNTTTYNLTDQLTLKNIFGYNYVGLKASTDLDATSLKIIDTYYDTHARQITDELQLQGDMDRFNWVIGGLYFHERGEDHLFSTQFAAINLKQNIVGINKSYAAFAQGTYKLTDQLSLTAGGRYTTDKRAVRYINPTSQAGTGPTVCTLPAVFVPAGAPCSVGVSKTFHQPTYTVSLDYKPTLDTLIYVAHRFGYRAGGFNSRVANSPIALAPFQPEKVRDLEVGFKGTFHMANGGYIRPTVALYKAWYDDIQKQTTTLVNGTATTLIINAASAKVQGFEAALAVGFSQNFELSGYAGYVDGHYEDFVNGPSTIPSLPFQTSKLTAGAAADWTVIRDRPRLGTIAAHANYSYRSPSYSDNNLPLVEPESRVPRQHNVNLALDWNDIGGSRVSVQGWVRNLLDQTHILGGTSLASSIGVVPLTVGEPRMYGATVKVRFGE